MTEQIPFWEDIDPNGTVEDRISRLERIAEGMVNFQVGGDRLSHNVEALTGNVGNLNALLVKVNANQKKIEDVEKKSATKEGVALQIRDVRKSRTVVVLLILLIVILLTVWWGSYAYKNRQLVRETKQQQYSSCVTDNKRTIIQIKSLTSQIVTLRGVVDTKPLQGLLDDYQNSLLDCEKLYPIDER